MIAITRGIKKNVYLDVKESGNHPLPVSQGFLLMVII